MKANYDGERLKAALWEKKHRRQHTFHKVKYDPLVTIPSGPTVRALLYFLPKTVGAVPNTPTAALSMSVLLQAQQASSEAQ